MLGCIDAGPVSGTSSHILGVAEGLEAGAHDGMPFQEGGAVEDIKAALLLLLQLLKSQLALKGVGEQLELVACTHLHS